MTGGIIGMLLAAEDESPIRWLVINDVVPFVRKMALEITERVPRAELVEFSGAAMRRP